MISRIHYQSGLPARQRFPDESVLFYDSILAKNKDFKKWSAQFKFKLILRSGENLKTVTSFNKLLAKISKLGVPHTTNLTFIAVGGGSVGDCIGFLASVYLRGRNLVLLPSTWLSAIDSAHGGKNGLNYNKVKNQIGSFYLPTDIFVCKTLLATQTEFRLVDALGEAIKIAILTDPKLFSEIEKNKNNFTSNHLFKLVKKCVDKKYLVVEKDPLEKTGHRRLLNLGHTLGHVFESRFGLPHGISVLYGLQFAARWSYTNKYLNEIDFLRITLLIEKFVPLAQLNKMLGSLKITEIKKMLSKDKKMTEKTKLDYIFINSIGKCTRKIVSLDDILKEVQRQKAEY